MKNDPVLAHLDYLQKRIFKGHALHLNAGILTVAEQSDLSDFLNTSTQPQKITCFKLKNNDFILFFNNNKTPILMDLTYVLKKRFPTLAQTRFDLKTHWETAHKKLYDIQIFPTQKTNLKIFDKLPTQPLTINVLTDLLKQLTPMVLNQNITPTTQILKLDLTYLRQKLFPTIDLNTNPVLTELLYQALTRRTWGQGNLYYPCCVLDLKGEIPAKITLRLSDILKHFDTYQSYRQNHPDTPIKIDRDIRPSALTDDLFKDKFVTF